MGCRGVSGGAVQRGGGGLSADLRSAWQTSNRVTIGLVRSLPAALWDAPVPEIPRRTVRTIAAHLHNSRCAWIRILGRQHGIRTPTRVDPRLVTPTGLVAALERSGGGIEALLVLGLEHDGELPPSKAYVWRNLSLDVAHVLTYFVAHEAHHRGQIVMIARQTRHRLPTAVTAALWQWKNDARRNAGRRRNN